ncbi:mechanosensitive ion channel domain-containing protein [Enhygromyxa salina]|uniref:Mechanosensitive ion channel n=1 Tax=Enhygromyxa salina TaxID=215803 RepID=A0A2S9YFN5_9BACT|nr:mechanosensitive ion channel domain-containing protein [Enhygromyxa salina]PRQ03924.1 Mechanosensitive ion channel [Enhygromyxa salina]
MQFALNSGWAVAALIVGGALALSLVTTRIGAAPALRGWQRALHVLSVLAWIGAGWLIGLRLLVADTLPETAARGLLVGVLVLIALPVLNDVIAGFALAIEGRHRLGEDVRVAAFEGRIVAFGLRSVVLRDRDGTETTLPYRRFASREVVRLNLARQDAPCEFEVELPRDVELEDASRRLLEAAILSAYAAPGHRPEVFAVADERGGMRVRVRAVVFDRAHEQRYRADVLARADLLGRNARIVRP